jgi:hypothetical protein
MEKEHGDAWFESGKVFPQFFDSARSAFLVFKVLREPDFCHRLVSDHTLCENFAKALMQIKDTEQLAKAFAKIARDKGAVDAFRALEAMMTEQQRDNLLNNVAAVYAKAYREGSVEGLQHLYPLVIEAQGVIAKKKAAKKQQ